MSVYKSTYRTSHSKSGYGKHYQKTYESGYYATLWNEIEKPLIKDIFNHLKSEGASTCLDFACGTGRITCVAEDVFDEVEGVDVSDEMLSIAKENLSKTKLINQDITSHLLGRSFDVISSFRFFLNAEPELRKSTLRALHQILNDKGTMVINIHVNKYSLLGRFYRIRNLTRKHIVANTLGWDELHELLQDAGFAIIDTRWYGYYPRTGWMLGSLATFCLSPFERFCKRARLLPKRWAQNYIVLCQKV